MCPPGTDQTTRGAQRWTILAPSLREKICLTGDGWRARDRGGPKDFIVKPLDWNAFDKLAKVNLDKIDLETMLSRLPTRSSDVQPSALERMPPELVAMIIADPSLALQDILALGLCSKSLWLHALRHIQLGQRDGQWANTPLMISGTYLLGVPPVIHSLHPDMKANEEGFFHRPGRGPRGAPSRGMCPARKWNWGALSSYKDQTLNEQWLEAFEASYTGSNIIYSELDLLRQSLVRIFSSRLGVKQEDLVSGSWILRNLTKREYVSLECKLGSEKEQIRMHVKDLPWLSLDKALVLRICWSSSIGHSFNESGRTVIDRLIAGTWAGDCFDVVHKGSHVEWRDVTDEIVREAQEVRDTFPIPADDPDELEDA